jgi:hypothetical protein
MLTTAYEREADDHDAKWVEQFHVAIRNKIDTQIERAA